MIEQALYEHLKVQTDLSAFLATYNEAPAVFNQEAPPDRDPGWGPGSQYGRVVFSVDLQGDPARTMGGVLSVDIMCKENEQYPEEIEPVVRSVIHGFFFSSGTFTVAAQWKNSSYFTEPTDQVTGCTVTFDLLAFPMLTTSNPDVIERINEWTAAIDGLHVINYDELPATAWKPGSEQSAVYWRLMQEAPAGWIPDTFQTIWRTATLKCHIFSEDIATATKVADDLTTRLYAAKRLTRPGETQIMVNRKNTADYGADPLRTGQLTVEATYGVIVHFTPEFTLKHIRHERRHLNGNKDQGNIR